MTTSDNTYPPALPNDLAESKPATRHTQAANAAVLAALCFEDRRDFENASRGFIASLDPLTIKRLRDGKTIYDLSDMSFLSDDAPPSANPSLWRQAQLLTRYCGLFEIIEGIYQIRSFDLANMTLIRGKSGWIVIDPLTSAESSKAALDLANEHLGQRPVTAVIYTHSHIDHFGGVMGVIDPDDVASGRVAVIAPEHFVKESLSENILAGNVMQRRATYMYGNLLPHSPKDFITDGLGPDLSMGSVGFVAPTDIIKKTGETRVVDGVEVEFQMTPGSEAVSEFVFCFPQFGALCMSEITSRHLHNVYTPRGAQVRDALAWAYQINESIDRFGSRLEVLFASHHWPIWGREEAVNYLNKQRDLYKYIHDQTLRLANHGYTKEEIAEQLELPDSLAKEFYNRGYYGTVSHNAKAVYVKYLGYFDGNPANLNPLPPSESAKSYVNYMGGAEAVLAKARESFKNGEYRWVAEVMNHVVMADPEHIHARGLLADTYEQLGYQAESGPWRNFYLCGALELRRGVPRGSAPRMSEAVARGIPIENMFQAMAVRLNGPKAADKHFAFNIDFTDLDETYLMTLENAVLNAFPGRRDKEPSASLRLTSLNFKRLMIGAASASDMITDGILVLEGDPVLFDEFISLFDQFIRRFPIVTPRDI